VTGKDDWTLEKLNGYGEPYRNPTGRVVNIAWYCTVRLDEDLELRLKSAEYMWVGINQIPALAYDHNTILDYARERLKRRVKRRPIGFSMLPIEFTMGQIQRLYESALQKPLDKRNFQRKLLKSELLIELDKTVKTSAAARRPAKLFKFNEKKYRNMSLVGYDFVYQ
jgi:8-oxo-dGTP diphosphatase